MGEKLLYRTHLIIAQARRARAEARVAQDALGRDHLRQRDDDEDVARGDGTRSDAAEAARVGDAPHGDAARIEVVRADAHPRFERGASIVRGGRVVLRGRI